MTILSRWEQTHAGRGPNDNYTPSDLSLRQLEKENARLKVMIAELLTKNQILRWKLREDPCGKGSSVDQNRDRADS
jgi:hypothetical protein